MSFKNNLINGKFDSILGQERTKKELKSTLLTGHNVIIVGPPGVGKTTLARDLADLLPDMQLKDCAYHCSPDNPICPSCKSESANDKSDNKTITIPGIKRFIRIQGSPDLTVEDLMGDIDPVKALEFGPLSIEAFTPGKIFKANNGILFFDEVNRCPEKLQNAMLQVLQEGKATIGSYDVDLPANFIFIGTMNPEDSSTEKLSDVFLDRFDIIYMSHPEKSETELQIIDNKGEKLDVEFPTRLKALMVEFVRSLRESDKLERVPSVRATISLYERAQSNAFLENRKTVEFNDIENAVISVLSHRIALKPSVKYLQDPTDFLKDELQEFIRQQNIEKGGDP